MSAETDLLVQLQHKIERNEAAFSFNPTVDDVYSVSSFLKVGSIFLVARWLAHWISQMYLRELPEPVFKFPLQDRIQHTEGIGVHSSSIPCLGPSTYWLV